MGDDELRRLPGVDALLTAAGGANGVPRPLAVEAVRRLIADTRTRAVAGAPIPALADLVESARVAVREAGRPSLRPVINASGVILQTNLGRAPLSERAIAAMSAVARGFSNLEYDLVTGDRGSRHEHVRSLIGQATGAEDGLVVNNNASGLLMVLQVFAQDREVIVSRGQAVEIGGGFRIPDVLRQSGARLVEVGTTNRTYADDYAAAITPETAAILRVHPSNFQITGFTAEAQLDELARIARERGLLLLDDLGSGCLVDTRRYGMAHEPTVQESVAAGVDLALFSGDKLLGGPQCGVIAGKGRLIAKLRRHPLARALRVDKLTIAALNATLLAYIAESPEELPTWRMVGAGLAAIRRRARRWAAAAGEAGGVVGARTMIGGGSLPGQGVPTWCATIRPPGGARRFAAALRSGDPAVVGRIVDEAVMLDPRTVDARNDRHVEAAIKQALIEVTSR